MSIRAPSGGEAPPSCRASACGKFQKAAQSDVACRGCWLSFAMALPIQFAKLSSAPSADAVGGPRGYTRASVISPARGQLEWLTRQGPNAHRGRQVAPYCRSVSRGARIRPPSGGAKPGVSGGQGVRGQGVRGGQGSGGWVPGASRELTWAPARRSNIVDQLLARASEGPRFALIRGRFRQFRGDRRRVPRKTGGCLVALIPRRGLPGGSPSKPLAGFSTGFSELGRITA